MQQLYVRYFDIEFDDASGKVKPVGIIRFDGNLPKQNVIPVVYIKNEVFEKGSNIDSLSQNVFQLTEQINSAIHQHPGTIQFDCDWTLGTKDRYFQFLSTFKTMSKTQISATIRLHQIKHRFATGVPPVDYGVLMFYNMGKIDASENNSIFDATIASRYLGQLNNYPLRLDIALPIFSWSFQIRNGKLIHLLNKMNDTQFEKDTCFQKTGKQRYKVVQGCFKGGYYFQQYDEVKVESISETQLLDMSDLLQKYTQKAVQQIVFYDLDEFNLKNHDTDIYQKVANSFN